MMASRLEKLERRKATDSLPYVLHFDETDEIARHNANGWCYALLPRQLTMEEWQKKYGGETCNAH
jgi:hypothetical protein